MLRQKSVASTGTVGVAGSTVAMVATYPAGIILLVIVAALLALLAWQRNRRSRAEAAAAAAVAEGADDGETCGWLNALATWFFLNKAASASADALPRLLEQRWLAALNAAIVEMAAEDGGGCAKIAKVLRFEELLVGSLPPQIRSAAAGHCSDTHELQIRLALRAEEIRLKARLGEAGVDSGGACCEVVLLDVEAEAALRVRLCPRGFTGSIRLLSRPRLRTESKPLDGCSVSGPDLASVSEVAVAALERAVTSLTMTEAADAAAIVGQKQQKQTWQQQSEPQQQASSSAAAVTRRHHHHSKQAQRTSQPAMTVTPLASATVATQQPGSKPRLLVKVIKASSLLLPAHSDFIGGDPAAASLGRQLNAYACLELDEPYQRHVTGSVFGSANPYWDQHYMFDLNANSGRLSMHVFDRSGRSDTLLGSASLRLSELPQLGARIMQPLRRPSRTAATVADSSSRPATVGPTATLTAEFLFVCPATRDDWPPMATISSSDTPSGRPNGDNSLSRALSANESTSPKPPSPENQSSAPVRCHSNREVDRNIDASNGNDNQDSIASKTTESPLYITVETLIVPKNWAGRLKQNQLSACAAAQHESPDVGNPKGKPAGRSHSFASRIRRAFTGGGGSGRRPVSSDRGELPVDSGLSGGQPPAVGSRGGGGSGRGGGGLSSSLRRLLSGGRLRGQKQRLRPKDTVQSSNPDAGRNGWNSEEIL